MATEYGELIPLQWAGSPEEFFVKGHLAPEVATEVINYEYDSHYKFTRPIPKYARFELCGSSLDDFGKNLPCLVVHDTPGRGKFAVMYAERIYEKKEQK